MKAFQVQVLDIYSKGVEMRPSKIRRWIIEGLLRDEGLHTDVRVKPDA